MLNQSTPILQRTKRAYLTYLESIVQLFKYPKLGSFEFLSSNINYEVEVDESITILRLIDEELKKREAAEHE